MEIYADNLGRTLGVQKALKVAENAMKQTLPGSWVNLPQSSVFYKLDRRGKEALDQKGLVRLHEFWKHIFHLLKKRAS